MTADLTLMVEENGSVRVKFGAQEIDLPGLAERMTHKHGENVAVDDHGLVGLERDGDLRLIGQRFIHLFSKARRLHKDIAEVLPQRLLYGAGFVIAVLFLALWHVGKRSRSEGKSA